MTDDETRRRHAAWLRECARRSELLAAEYRANADRIDPDSDERGFFTYDEHGRRVTE